MTLTDDQKAAVATWLEAGAGLPDVQRRLREDFQISLTYLETRFLVDDLRLSLKEPEPEPTPAPAAPSPAAAENAAEPPPLPGGEDEFFDDPLPPEGGGKVSVSIDQIARPNALISGKVTFSDGEIAEWYLDQMGRLGLNPTTMGYRPSERDVMAFQVELQRLARSQGF